MPYIVTTSSGTAIATIPDNTVNTTTTSIALVGKNYAGYGAFLNENYVKILENFSNSIAPVAPLTGQLWWDSTNTLLKVWTGAQWKQMHSSAASPTEPPVKITGDLWWDTTNLVLKVYGGSAWVTIGPGSGGGSGGSTTGALIDTIVDTGSLSHAVIKLSVANQTIAIISKDSVFTPGTAIPGFPSVYPGVTLINTSGYNFTGNATNSLAVNNISSNSFLTSLSDQVTTWKLTVGRLQAASDLLLDPSAGSEVQIYSNGGGGGTGKDLNLYVNKSGIQTKGLGISAASGAIIVNAANGPTAIVNGGTSGVGNIGTSSGTFNTIFAKATTAVYADLAEIYATDKEYAVGTVIKVGGTAEVTAATYGDRAIGVISANPAFLMNNTAKGQPVALKGRVPVKVQGTVKKGDKLVPAQNIYGAASTIVNQNDPDYFAIALEDHQQDSGIIECLIL
jgi:hypothetical protein